MTNLLFIMIGGALGSGLRYLTHTAFARWLGGGFPYGILIVNVLGCLLVGILGYLFTGAAPVPAAVDADAAGMRETWRLGLIVGVLGGFTTFSSFGYDTFKLWLDHEYAKAIANVALSNVLSLGAVWIGYSAAQRWS